MNTVPPPHLRDLTVVVVSYNTRDLLLQCVRSVLDDRGDLDLEVIVVDNDSADGSADAVAAALPEVVLLRSRVNLGFAAACNLAFRASSGRHVLLLNPDAVLRPGTLEGAIARMDLSPGVAAAGGRLVAPDGSAQPSARRFPSLLDELLVISGLAARFPNSRFFGRFDRTWADPSREAVVDWVPGAFALLRREVLEVVGCFDEDFFLYYEEVDLFRRIAAAGMEVHYWPQFVIEHVGGASSRTRPSMTVSRKGSQLTLWRMRSALLYWRKHHGAVGAWTAAAIEGGWHRVRALRNGLSSSPQRRERADESLEQVRLLSLAWAETAGGRVSPPRPW